MDTSGKRAVGLRDSGFINVGGRRKQPNDDLRTPWKTNLNEDFRTPPRKYLDDYTRALPSMKLEKDNAIKELKDIRTSLRKYPDDDMRALPSMKLKHDNAMKKLKDFRTPLRKYPDDDMRALQSMKLELDNAKKELKDTYAKLKRSECQVNHLSTENDKIQETLRAQDITLEGSRKKIKLLNDLLEAYEMLLRKTEEKNPKIRSNKEYNEYCSHCLESNEEVKQMKIMFEDLTVNIVKETMAASEATNNKLETMGAEITDLKSMLTNMSAMMTQLMQKSSDDGRSDTLPLTPTTQQLIWETLVTKNFAVLVFCIV